MLLNPNSYNDSVKIDQWKVDDKGWMQIMQVSLLKNTSHRKGQDVFSDSQVNFFTQL